MASQLAANDIASALEQYYPSRVHSISAEAINDPVQASQKLFPDLAYTASEQKEIPAELGRASKLAGSITDLKELNSHLSQRTTLLGAKPSVADVVLYARLVPLVKSWSREQRTGKDGHHHIVRYVDFVQHSDTFALEVPEADKVNIDPADVAFFPKPLDPKEEKERKKREKAAAAAAAAGGNEGADGKSKKDKVKNAVANVKDAAKGAVAGELPVREKKDKKEKGAKQPKPQPVAKEVMLTPALIDLRVGHILKAERHPNADSLYVSTIAVGDPAGTENTSEYEGQTVRTVCSGLNGLVPLEDMQNRTIVAVCNLKPVTMRGVKSCAMVLAASPRDAEAHAGPVELVSPPAGAVAGQRIWFEGWEGEPEGVLNPKKKIWESCQLGFTTTEDLGVAFEKAAVEALREKTDKPAAGKLRVKDGGYCLVASLKGATVR